MSRDVVFSVPNKVDLTLLQLPTVLREVPDVFFGAKTDMSSFKMWLAARDDA